MRRERLTRRGFVRNTAALAAGLNLVRAPRPALGTLGANERVVWGLIGCGGQARAHLADLNRMNDVGIAAVCDVDASRREAAAKLAAGSPQAFVDFRRLLDMKEIDAVLIATPDHWHAIPAIQACQADKDFYLEKPIGHNIREGRAIAEAAARHKRVSCIGLQQRSGTHWINAIIRIRSGELGRICSVDAWNCWNLGEMGGTLPPAQGDCPPGVDYDFWLGPAPQRPFSPQRFHFTYNFFWDYGGGMISGWAVHLFDIVLWAMGSSIRSVTTAGGKFVTRDERDTPDTADAVFECPDYVLHYSIRHGNPWRPHGDMDHGITFFGTQGTLQVNRRGFEIYHPDEYSQRKPACKETLEGGRDDTMFQHKRHFLDCVRSREKCRVDAETGHRSAIPGHLANISYRVGRKLTWDEKAEAIVGDEEAARLLARSYRAPWVL